MLTPRRAASAAAALIWCGCAQRAVAPGPPATLLEDVAFAQYTPLSRSAEIARRALPPLVVLRLAHPLAADAREQPVDLANERFTLYVPAGPPPKDGYGLLVFVAPWAEPTRPRLWRAALDRHHLVFVSATNSGNNTRVLDRRLPLALLAWENVRARYPIDARRVFIGGLSGGSRVAEIAALAYPDVFRGALLNAGSDPIGPASGIYLPPPDLFHLFQSSRLVFATGESDDFNLRDDAATRASLREWCVFDVEVKNARGLGHEPLDGPAFERAVAALDATAGADDKDLARCNARIDGELASKTAEAGAAIDAGDRDQAWKLLNEIDGRYAGLAASTLEQLAARMVSRFGSR